MDIVKETKIPESGWTQHYDVVRELGDCYASVGEYEQAHECYEKAASLAPDVENLDFILHLVDGLEPANH